MIGRVFRRERPIRFSDCDPAGIVFYPQYFVMFNALVEDGFDAADDGLGIGYRALIVERRIGLPTVRLQAEFRAVSRQGDTVGLELEIERLGGRSIALCLGCRGAAGGDTGLRMRMHQVLVTTSLNSHRAIAIPPDVRRALDAWLPADRH